MGCDGNTPNVICPSRISPLVRPWLHALPTPTNDGPLNNYLAPAIPDTILGNSDYYMGRFDMQIRNNDHIFTSVWHQRAPAKFVSVLPQPIANETYSDPQNSWVSRLNWDRTFSSTLLNHMSMGYLNRNEGYGSVNQSFVDDFPQIAGVAGYNVPPQMSFSDGFAQFGNNAGINIGNVTTRPTFIINDSLTWTKGAHTMKVGMEYRKIRGNIHANGNQAGHLHLRARRHGPGRRQQRQPDRQLPAGRGRQRQRDVPRRGLRVSAAERVDPPRRRHLERERASSRSTTACAGTTTRRRRRSTTASPSSIRQAPTPAPAAGPGGSPLPATATAPPATARAIPRRTSTAGSRRGSAPSTGSTTRRSSAAAGASSTCRRSIRAGAAASRRTGSRPRRRSTARLGGIQPAFFLEQGLPQNFARPPLIQSDYRNGQELAVPPARRQQAPVLAPVEHHRGPRDRTQPLAERGLRGSAGRRLPSSIEPLNAIDPNYLSMGDALYDEFHPA